MDDFKQPKITPFGESEDENPQEPPMSTNEDSMDENYSDDRQRAAQDSIETIDLSTEPDDMSVKKKNFNLKDLFKNWSKRKKIIVSIIIVILLLVAGFLTYWFVFKSDTPSQVVVKKTPKPKKIVKKIISPLTGLELNDETLAKRPVTAIMIENSPDARPQSGLNEAGIVVEAIAEGGVTRFLALFQEARPQYIGPVRSARPYYIDFALAFDASYCHVGGSPDALNDIKSLGVKDLDQFFNSGAYWRISERFAPHNMYTSFDRLDNLNTSKGYTSSKFTPLDRKKDTPQTPTASVIDFSVSGPTYNPHFQYDQTTNSYKRSQAGTAHVDLKSGSQISSKVIVALVMSRGTSDGYHSSYADVGSGKAYVFQDGIVSEGTWAKADRKGALTLTDKNGLSLKINAGQTWITLVGAASDVVYRP